MQDSRSVDDGMLYVSYDADSNEIYLSHVGYGSADANRTLACQWTSASVEVSVGGGSGVTLGLGEAYLDNFVVDQATMLGWLPVTDLYTDGYIDVADLAVIADNWLSTDAGVEGGDINGNGAGDGIVNFRDVAELGLAW